MSARKDKQELHMCRPPDVAPARGGSWRIERENSAGGCSVQGLERLLSANSESHLACLLFERRQPDPQNHSQIVDVMGDIVIDGQIQVSADRIESVVAFSRPVHIQSHPALVPAVAK